MRAQILVVTAIVGSALVGAAPAAAQTTQAYGAGGSATHTLTVRVPVVVRFSIAKGQATSNGAPLLQVETNDPAIRRMVAGGVAPEELQALSVQFSGSQHAKGGEQALGGPAQVTESVVRYTIVRP
jgi:hypothetical protein